MNTSPIVPQLVHWGPSDGRPAGIRVLNSENVEQTFIPRTELKTEIERLLLPQLFADPKGYTFEVKDYHGKPDWVVQVCKASERYCDVWFGKDPEKGWRFDGLIRVGDADEPPHVWHTYQRFSDGTYRRLSSLRPTIDEFVRQQKEK